MRPGTRYAVAVALVLAIVMSSIGASLYLSARAIGDAQRKWCDTLTLLTSRPVARPADPAANPSRAGQYRLYVDFVQLRDEFGC